MGLRTMPAENWVESGSDVINQLNQRNELIRNSRNLVFATLPGFEDPSMEFARLIMQNLKEFHTQSYDVMADGEITHLPSNIKANINSDHPFLQLARVICEDLCLISRIEDQWVLTAAAVLFPSRWKLSEKLGKNLDEIHIPVPGYQETLQPAMNLTFDRLTVDRQVWRLNWALHADSELHQPTAHSISAAPEKYWWRTERQTLTKLPSSQHVLFTIRNRTEPFSQLLSDPTHAKAFAQTLSSMTPESIEYKGLSQDHQAIIDYLISG